MKYQLYANASKNNRWLKVVIANDLFDNKSIFLRSYSWIAIFSIWVEARLFGMSRF